MEIVFYLLTILGSSSFGYSLLRTGFPKTQQLKTVNKIIYGYGIGLLVVIPSVITAMYFGAGSFFLMLGLIYGLLFLILFTKRISYLDKDDIKLIKTKAKKAALPKKVVTAEEKETKRKVKEVSRVAVNTLSVKPIKIKEHIFKEKQPSVITQLHKKTIEIEKEKKKEEKLTALKKMKSFATQIDKKKSKNKNDIDEDELNNLGEGF